MNKQELMTLISQTLLGQSTYSFYRVNDLVREKLNDWFDNSQGYYSTRVNAFTITITYKNGGLFTFTCKRHQGCVCEIVDADEYFVDTEQRQKDIEKRLLNAFNEEHYFNLHDVKTDKLVDVLHAIKGILKDVKVRDIKYYLRELYDNFYAVNEIELQKGRKQ